MTNELCKWMKVAKEARRFKERCRNENREYFLATEVSCRDECALGENIMPKRLLIALLGAAFTCATLIAQELPLIHQPTITPQDSGTTNGLIAVSPVNPQVVWASGRNGTFTLTTDGGGTWNAGVVPGAEALQFRDVQGFSARVAYLMSIGNNPTDFRVYKTLDGGATWTIQFENQNLL
jgi:photosystem II stability/assembly factor-like uncharacterized protein